MKIQNECKHYDAEIIFHAQNASVAISKKHFTQLPGSKKSSSVNNLIQICYLNNDINYVSSLNHRKIRAVSTI